MHGVLQACKPKPTARFCLAIEEGEAWLLGDKVAVTTAYPRAKDAVLRSYQQDSICGTWETLADAVFDGGADALKAKSWQAVGAEKSAWALRISPHVDVNRNASPSFETFSRALRALVTGS